MAEKKGLTREDSKQTDDGGGTRKEHEGSEEQEGVMSDGVHTHNDENQRLQATKTNAKTTKKTAEEGRTDRDRQELAREEGKAPETPKSHLTRTRLAPASKRQEQHQ